MKEVRFSSPVPRNKTSPHVDGESLRDLSTAEQAFVAKDAFLPHKPDPVWIRLRQVLCGPSRRPLPKTPPSSPYIAPERPFHAYHLLRHKLVDAANRCVETMVDDRQRVQRHAALGMPCKLREIEVVVGPVFCFGRLPYMGLAHVPEHDGWVDAEQFGELDVAEPMLGIDNDIHWGQSLGYDHLCEAIDRLRRWCGKNGLENLRVCLGTEGGPTDLNGIERYRVTSIWLKTDAPDICASFSLPHEIGI